MILKYDAINRTTLNRLINPCTLMTQTKLNTSIYITRSSCTYGYFHFLFYTIKVMTAECKFLFKFKYV